MRWRGKHPRMPDDEKIQDDPQMGEGPAEPPLTDVESPLADDDTAQSDTDDGHGWIPPIP
jgi:hypothetical protein